MFALSGLGAKTTCRGWKGGHGIKKFEKRWSTPTYSPRTKTHICRVLVESRDDGMSGGEAPLKRSRQSTLRWRSECGFRTAVHSPEWHESKVNRTTPSLHKRVGRKWALDVLAQFSNQNVRIFGAIDAKPNGFGRVCSFGKPLNYKSLQTNRKIKQPGCNLTVKLW